MLVCLLFFSISSLFNWLIVQGNQEGARGGDNYNIFRLVERLRNEFEGFREIII